MPSPFIHSRRTFLHVSAASSLLATTARADEEPLVTIGLMADCQYADSDINGTRHYRESPRKLEEAVEELNRHDPAMVFHLGDFIDQYFESFDRLAPIAAKLNAPLHHILGNHDYDVPDELKEKVPATLGMESCYYSIRKEPFRFIVIDTTDVSTYRYPEGSELDRVHEAELDRHEAAGVPGAKPWNGRPGDEQIAWLEEELREATAADEIVIVMGHHPILPLEGHTIWNAPRLDALLREYPCAKVYLNGHNHAGAYSDADGFHYLTLDGMVETRDENAFSHARLYRDRMELIGFGRQESYRLPFR
jgi:3',5'-cyclic AMP phosphodiesterase CpdA